MILLNTVLETITEALMKLLGQLPNILVAFLIFFIGRMIARAVARVLRKLFAKTGIDKLNDKFNEIELVHQSNVEVKLSSILSQVVYYLLVFVFLVVAVDFLNMKAISDLLTDFIAYLPKLISALAVLMAGLLFADFLRKTVKTTFQSLGVPSAGLISNFIFYFLLVNVLLTALRQAEFMTEFLEDNISILFAGLVAAFSIAYGFGARNMMGSMLTGFYRKEAIQEGMKIEIDGVRGTIESIDSTTLSLRTQDGLMVIPMNKLMSTSYTILDD